MKADTQLEMTSDPHITYRRKPASLDLPALEAFAEVLRQRIARGKEFHCRITNDAELQALNLQFRAKDYPTDVLTFDSGDIAISLNRARAQAREFGHSVEDELRILLLHAVLHLTGLDHETDTGQMKRAEVRWRKKLSLPLTLIERVS